MSEADDPAPVGLVPVGGRGSLPYALLDGESLVACAGWALGAAGITPYDATVPWQRVVASGRVVVVHDPLCPLTPPAFLAEVAAAARDTGEVAVGVRPVTDTLKPLDGTVDGGTLGATVDRDRLLQVVSPIALPAAGVAALDAAPESVGFADLLVDLHARGVSVRTVEAPPSARRVGSTDDLRLWSGRGQWAAFTSTAT